MFATGKVPTTAKTAPTTATGIVPTTGFPHGRGFQKKEKITAPDPVLRRVLETISSSGKTLTQIAALSGVSATTIYKWVDGTTKRPQFFTISQVMKALGFKNEWRRQQ